MTETTPPAPLVPAEVDLRDFGFMPLDVRTLLSSSLWIKAKKDPRLGHAAMSLWCESWHQVPAASLPDDDEVLAELARCDEKEWRRIKDRVLANFVKCDDGRLYHETVAKKALESWSAKVAQRARTKAATEAREAKKRARDEQRDDDRNGQRDEQRDVARGESRDVHQGTGTVKGQGQGDSVKTNTSTPDGVDRARPPDDHPQLALVDDIRGIPWSPPDCPHGAVLALWAEVLPTLPQHVPSQWKGARADHLRARWRETAEEKRWPDQAAGLAYLRKLFAYVGKSRFLTGRASTAPDKRPFVVELEWLVKPANWAKLIEGKYHQDAS